MSVCFKLTRSTLPLLPGVECVDCYCVDNLLARVGDPLFVGYCHSQGWSKKCFLQLCVSQQSRTSPKQLWGSQGKKCKGVMRYQRSQPFHMSLCC